MFAACGLCRSQVCAFVMCAGGPAAGAKKNASNLVLVLVRTRTGTRTLVVEYFLTYGMSLFLLRSDIFHVTSSPSGVWVPGPIRSLLFCLECLYLTALSFPDRHHFTLYVPPQRGHLARDFFPLSSMAAGTNAKPCNMYAQAKGPLKTKTDSGNKIEKNKLKQKGIKN